MILRPSGLISKVPLQLFVGKSPRPLQLAAGRRDAEQAVFTCGIDIMVEEQVAPGVVLIQDVDKTDLETTGLQSPSGVGRISTFRFRLLNRMSEPHPAIPMHSPMSGAAPRSSPARSRFPIAAISPPSMPTLSRLGLSGFFQGGSGFRISPERSASHPLAITLLLIGSHSRQ
jgi:hypothetical protein